MHFFLYLSMYILSYCMVGGFLEFFNYKFLLFFLIGACFAARKHRRCYHTTYDPPLPYNQPHAHSLLSPKDSTRDISKFSRLNIVPFWPESLSCHAPACYSTYPRSLYVCVLRVLASGSNIVRPRRRTLYYPRFQKLMW